MHGHLHAICMTLVVSNVAEGGLEPNNNDGVLGLGGRGTEV